MTNVDSSGAAAMILTNNAASPEASSTKQKQQRRFSLVRLFAGKKRSNRTAATTGFGDDESLFLNGADDDDILLDLTKKKGRRRRRRKSFFQSSTASVSLSSTSKRSSSWSLRNQNRKTQVNAVSTLLDMGDAEWEAQREDRAIICWKQATRLSKGDDVTPLLHELALWKLALLHIQKSVAHESFRSEAISYLNQIMESTTRIPDAWLQEVVPKETEASILLEVFLEMTWYSPALRLAEIMSDDVVSPHTISKIRFQMAQQSGNVELLKESCNSSSEGLHREAIMALAKAYAKRGEWDVALETNSKLLETSTLQNDRAEAFAQRAELLFKQDQVDLAWDALQQGFDDSDTCNKDPLAELLLLQTKAQLLYKTGFYLESIQVHQEVLSKWRSIKGPICPEIAKTYYTMGRICIKANICHKAVECFCQELHVTQSALGKSHLEVARILHEIARLYDEHLGDYTKALHFYKRALTVEQGLVRLGEGGQRELLLQIRETQKCMGRIHYKKGDFGMAVKTSFDNVVS